MNEPCRVCGEPTTEYCNAVCLRCTAPFHLALRQDIPGKDCGEVWIDEENLSLDFACNLCLAAERGEPAAPPPPARNMERTATRRYARHTGARAGDIVRRRRPS